MAATPVGQFWTRWEVPATAANQALTTGPLMATSLAVAAVARGLVGLDQAADQALGRDRVVVAAMGKTAATGKTKAAKTDA